MAGPSAMGSENGMPSSMMSAPRRGKLLQDFERTFRIGIAGGNEGDDPPVQRTKLGEARSDAAHQFAARAFATVR